MNINLFQLTSVHLKIKGQSEKQLAFIWDPAAILKALIQTETLSSK